VRPHAGSSDGESPDTGMIRKAARMMFMAVVVLAVAILAVMVLGLERVWSLFGPPDLGPVTFETLQRRITPNDALACPEDLCRAHSDVTPPVFAVGADRLRQAMAEVLASEPDVTQVEAAALTARYIQRTRWMRFPDTIVLRYVPLGADRSTIALYSRSQLGSGDMGVNKARVMRWLDKLSRKVAIAK
jgi:uncharacterized protein (DUF1499 family)